MMQGSAFGNPKPVNAQLLAYLDAASTNAGQDSLIGAAAAGDLARVKALLAAKADVNARAANRATALLVASYRGHLQIVKTLIAAKADVNAKALYGITPLMAASAGGHLEVLKVLLAAKADLVFGALGMARDPAAGRFWSAPSEYTMISSPRPGSAARSQRPAANTGRSCGQYPAWWCADGDRALLSPCAASAFLHADGRSCTPRQPINLSACANRRMGTPGAADRGDA
jgi:ankyrin repeat protein